MKNAISTAYLDNTGRASVFSRNFWRAAIYELRDVKKLCIAAMMAALSVLLQYISIPLTSGLQIQITFTVSAISGVVLGPILSLIRGAVADIVGFFLSGEGAFYWGYTLSAALSACLYSLFFWRRDLTFPRILAVKAIVNIGINAGLGSLWNLRLLGAKSYGAYFALAIAKNLLLLPIEVVIILLLFRAIAGPLSRMRLMPRQRDIALTKKAIAAAILLAVIAAALVVIYFAKPAFLTDFFKTVYTAVKDFFKGIFK